MNKGKKKGPGLYAPVLKQSRAFMGRGVQPAAPVASLSKNSCSFSTVVSGWVSMRM